MISRPDILKLLLGYVSGDMAIGALRDYLMGFRLDEELDGPARLLLADIEGRYGEYSDELVSEEFLKERFRDMIQPTSRTVVNPSMFFESTMGIQQTSTVVVSGSTAAAEQSGQLHFAPA